MPILNLSLPSDGTNADVNDVNIPFQALLALLNGGLDDLNIASLSGTKIVPGTIPDTALSLTAKAGWLTGGLPVVSSVLYNGNRSYDVTFASSVASLLSPGMRLRTTRTAPAPTYMGGTFNGTNQYFSKTTPTGALGTVTDNFTIMAWCYLTAYPAAGSSSVIAGRGDATPANAMYLEVNSNGQVRVVVYNGGATNSRAVSSYVSIPLNKKVHIAATWASGSVSIYIDGIPVSVQPAATSGTAPTTAGTGGDFSIGRLGAFVAGGYWTGRISAVGMFNAVLSAATLRSYISQSLTGSESNCIGAWDLFNRVTDQSSLGNNVTAQGSIGFSSGVSPYSTNSNGVSGGTQDFAIVQAVGTTVITVQVPEGCTIPTIGGVSTVDYSSLKVPFGMTMDTNRWIVEVLINASISSSGTTISTVYNLGSVAITVPIGNWKVEARLGWQVTVSSGTVADIYTGISTSSSTFIQGQNGAECREYLSGFSGSPLRIFNTSHIVEHSSPDATPWYLLALYALGTLSVLQVRGSIFSSNTYEASRMVATPSYL
jgi:hypothetical protein